MAWKYFISHSCLCQNSIVSFAAWIYMLGAIRILPVYVFGTSALDCSSWPRYIDLISSPCLTGWPCCHQCLHPLLPEWQWEDKCSWWSYPPLPTPSSLQFCQRHSEQALPAGCILPISLLLLGSSNKFLINQLSYLILQEERFKKKKMGTSSWDKPTSELCQNAASQSVLKGDP